MTQKQMLSDEEVLFHLKDMFVSKTDKKGLIQYGNQVFTRMSGYTNEELVGSPHNIIRHQDMPRAVFKLLWTYLKDNKAIFAYVKNRAKSGKYYWVMAAVMPTPDGYFSVRIKPTCGILATVETLYKEALSVERDKGMDGALQFISEKLQALGFSSYNDFMIHAVTEEISSRESKMASVDFYTNGSKLNATGLQKKLFEMQNRVLSTKSVYSDSVAQLAKYKNFKSNSQESIINITKSLPKLEHLSVNMSIAANKLGKQGSTLAVVSSYFDKTAKDVVSLLGQIENLFASVSTKLSTIIVNSSCSRLMIDMIGQYLAEAHAEISEAIISDSQKMTLLKRNEEMVATFNDFLNELKPQKNVFLDETFELKKTIDLLIRNTSKLDLVKTGAKLESSNAPFIAENFQPFILEISQIIASITEALNFVKDQVSQLCDDFENINISTVLVEHTIQEILLMNEGLKISVEDQKTQPERVA